MSKEKLIKARDYCCKRFGFYVADKVIHNIFDHTDEVDETEWVAEELGHLYYCPYCGKNIKGNGFGTYDEEHAD
ncbi:hypothetical protein KAR48_03735 [bacterium]|nr:hypothetical protein [bacterium]